MFFTCRNLSFEEQPAQPWAKLCSPIFLGILLLSLPHSTVEQWAGLLGRRKRAGQLSPPQRSVLPGRMGAADILTSTPSSSHAAQLRCCFQPFYVPQYSCAAPPALQGRPRGPAACGTTLSTTTPLQLCTKPRWHLSLLESCSA